MRFSELCLLYENSYRFVLVKGNYGAPLSAQQYKKAIDDYKSRKSTTGRSKLIFYLGRPNQPDKCNIDLIYHLIPENNIPANYYFYSVPQNTLRKFRSLGEELKSKRNEAYFQPLQNIFYYRNQPVPKFFSENNFIKEMETLIKVNEFFVNKFGIQYSFLGDVYTLEEGSKLSRIKLNLQRNKEDLKNLPKYFKDWWDNL